MKWLLSVLLCMSSLSAWSQNQCSSDKDCPMGTSCRMGKTSCGPASTCAALQCQRVEPLPPANMVSPLKAPTPTPSTMLSPQTLITPGCGPDDGPAIRIQQYTQTHRMTFTLRSQSLRDAKAGALTMSIDSNDFSVCRADMKCQLTSGRLTLNEPAGFEEGSVWKGTLYWREQHGEKAIEKSVPFLGTYKSSPFRELCG